MTDNDAQRQIDNLSDLLQGRDAEPRNRPLPGDRECPVCRVVSGWMRESTPGECCADAFGYPKYYGMPQRGKQR